MGGTSRDLSHTDITSLNAFSINPNGFSETKYIITFVIHAYCGWYYYCTFRDLVRPPILAGHGHCAACLVRVQQRDQLLDLDHTGQTFVDFPTVS